MTGGLAVEVWWRWIGVGALHATPWLAAALVVERLGRERLHPGLLHGVLALAALELLVPWGWLGVVPDLALGVPAGLGAGGDVAGAAVPDASGLRAGGALGLWVAGALGLWFALALRTRALGRLWRSAHRAGPRVAALASSAAADLGLRRTPPVGVTPELSGPLVAGLLSPRVLLPETLVRSLPETRLRHLVLHELAHVRRRDLWWEAGGAVLAGLFWFHPLVHLLRARARGLREACSDAEAARRAPDGAYRETLALVGRALLDRPRPAAPAAAPFAGGAELVWRVRTLARTGRLRPAGRRRAAAAALVLLAAVGLAVGPGHGAGAPVPAVPPTAEADAALLHARAVLRARGEGRAGSLHVRNALLRLRNAAPAAPGGATPRTTESP